MPVSKLGLQIVVEGERAAIQALSQVDRATNKAARGMSGVGKQIGQLGGKITSVGRTIAQSGLALTFGLTVPLAMAGKELVEAGIAFEDTFAGIAKTIEGVADVGENGTLVLTDMGESLKEMIRTMALDMPIAATELNKIGQIAGQLGVRGKENLETYIDTVAKMGVATDLSTEKAAFGFARVANIMGIAEEEIGEFAKSMGAAIVHLGNTTASTEPEILNLTMRIAGAGRVAGLSTAEMLGFASAAAQLGVPAERGGTAVSRIFQEMGFAVGQGVETTTAAIQTIPAQYRASAEALLSERNKLAEKIATTQIMGAQGFGEFSPFETESQFEGQLSSLQLKLGQVDSALGFINGTTTETVATMTSASDSMSVFAAIANQGTSEAVIGVEEFANIFETDAIRATELFISGMAKMQEEGTLTEEMLTEIGMSGVRVRDTINRFGGSANFATGEIKILRDAVEESNAAFKAQTALNEEAEKRFATMRSQLQLVKNAFMDLGITLFDLVKDDLKALLDGIISLFEWFKGLTNETKKVILVVAGIAAALGPILVLVGGAVVAFGSLITAIGGFIALGAPLLVLLGGMTAALVGLAAVAGPLLFQAITEHIQVTGQREQSAEGVAEAQQEQQDIIDEATTGPSGTQVSFGPGGPVSDEARVTSLDADQQAAFDRAQTEEALAGMRGIESPDVEGLTTFRDALAQVGEIFVMLGNVMKETLQPALDGLKEAWGETGLTLEDVVMAVGIVLAAVVGSILAIITGLINAFLRAGQVLGEVKNALVNIWSEGGNILQNIILTIITVIIGLIATILALIGGFVEGVIKFFVNLFDELVGGSIWTDTWQTMLDQVTEFTQGILDKILTWKDNIVDAFNKLKEGIFNVVNKIKDKLDDIAEAAANVLSKITGSPELKIQHAFEEFEDFLAGADFGFSLNPSMNPASGAGQSINNSRSTENNFNIQGMPMDNARSFAGEMMNQLRIMETVGG